MTIYCPRIRARARARVMQERVTYAHREETRKVTSDWEGGGDPQSADHAIYDYSTDSADVDVPSVRCEGKGARKNRYRGKSADVQTRGSPLSPGEKDRDRSENDHENDSSERPRRIDRWKRDR